MIQEERINNWIESYDGNGYLNGSILVASNGNVLLNKGFGMANWQHKVKNTSTTKFQIGSITKAFTAMCIFLLHESKKLNINDYISKYLDDYPNGDRITIYHCLTNTTGIVNYTSFPDYWSRTMRLPSTMDQLIDSFKNHDLEIEPGSSFRYSNSGYVLLTAIIEKVSVKPYADFIQEQICYPLGMRNTGYYNGTTIVPDLASGYSYWKEPIHPAYADMSLALGAFCLYSTTEDLFLWDKALTTSQLLSDDLTKIMFTPYHSSYSCGWMTNDMLGRKCVNHFGDISGFFSDFLRFVDNNVTIIFLSNMNVTPVTHLSRDIAKIIFDENVTLPI